MLNKVILIGNIGSDPEIKTFDNGSVANFRIATNETYKDRNGEKKTQTEWHNIRIGIPSLVDLTQRYIKKGDLLYIEGKIKYREYEKEGQKRYITEINADTIRFMPKGNNGGNQTQEGETNQTTNSQTISKPTTTNENFISEVNNVDDDLPF